jgi:AcrR family transcriptional regulator
LRADAKRNRERVLEAAEQIFAGEGLAIPIDEIAKRAGVGVGTVYRHFPTKEVLFAAIVEDKLARITKLATSLADAPDPGYAFFTVLDRMLAEGTRKKDLVDALTGAGIDIRATTSETSAALRTAIGKLLRRAQVAGAVRTNIDVGEVFALLGAVLSAAARTEASPQRLFAVVRDGLRAGTR